MKTLLTLSSVALIAISAQGAELLSGWDFSNYVIPGNSATQQEFSSSASSVISLYKGSSSELKSDGASTSNGTINYKDSLIKAASGSLSQGTTISTRALGPNFGSVTAANGGGGNYSMQLNAGATGFFLEADTLGLTIDFTDSSSYLQYTSTIKAGSAAATIEWFYSLDGGSSYLSTGTSDVIGNSLASGGTIYTVDLSDLGTSYSGDILLRADVSGVTLGSELLIDNIQLQGTVVPEPSTYATLAGIAVLGLVIIRRRRA